jgi:hypothetical protein
MQPLQARCGLIIFANAAGRIISKYTAAQVAQATYRLPDQQRVWLFTFPGQGCLGELGKLLRFCFPHPFWLGRSVLSQLCP